MTLEASGRERLWTAGAIVCMVVAAEALLWNWNVEVAFVAATLGAVSWFMGVRERLVKSTTSATARTEENDHSGDEDESE